MLLSLLLLYRGHYRVDTTAKYACLTSFGFETNGTYILSSSPVSSTDVYLLMLNRKQIPTPNELQENDMAFCSSKLIAQTVNTILPTSGSTSVLNGTVESSDVFYYCVANCGTGKMTVTIDAILRNPTMMVDSRWKYAPTVQKAVLGVVLALLILWMINWFMHFSMQIGIQYFMTVVFCMALLYHVIRLAELKTIFETDDSNTLTIIRYICLFIGLALFFTVLLLTSKGWCIIRDTLTIKEFTKSIIYSFGYIGLAILNNFADLGKFETLVILLMFAAILLFVNELIDGIDDASLHILAHMLAISNSGIDPETTPVYLKHKMYLYFQYLVVIASSMLLGTILVDVFFDIPYWIDEMMYNLIEIFILGSFGWIMRLRGSDAEGYSMMGDLMGNREEIALSDIEHITQQDLFSRGGARWEHGMKIPPQPVLVNTPNEIVLDTPDGTNTLQARITNVNEL